MENKMYVIGIAGGSGSGKTTLVQRLSGSLGSRACILYHDDYYKAHDELPLAERAKLNYDHPDAFDTDMMVSHIRQLKNGQTIECPTYDYAVHNRRSETKTIVPTPVIIIEGILILADERLRELMDLRVFVDAADDERILRRIKRDVGERGRSLDSIIGQYLTTVKPMHKQYVEPSKAFADIIVPRGGYNDIAYEMIDHEIKQHIQSV